MTDREGMAAQVDAQISADTRDHIRRLFAERKVRPSGALFMAQQAGEDITGLTRLHIAAWLAAG